MKPELLARLLPEEREVYGAVIDYALFHKGSFENKIHDALESLAQSRADLADRDRSHKEALDLLCDMTKANDSYLKQFADLQTQNESIEADLAKAVAMLKELEFCIGQFNDDGVLVARLCPKCGSHKHTPESDCALAELVKEG